MDEQGLAENVKREMEKRINPKSTKGKRNEENAIGMLEEAQGMVTTKAVEHERISEKEDIAEMKRIHKRDKEKKKKKGSKDGVAHTKKNAGEGELIIAYDEDSIGDAKDNAVRKRKKRENNKNDGFEMGSTNVVVGNECKRWREGERINGIESTKEARKEVGAHRPDEKTHAMEMVEKKRGKIEKKISRVDNWWQDSFCEAKHDEGDISQLHKENVLDNVEGYTQLTNYVSNATKELKRKKKKKTKKKEDSAQQVSVDEDVNDLEQNDKLEIFGEEYANKRKKKKIKLVVNGSDDTWDNQAEYADGGKKRKTKLVDRRSDDPRPNKSSKKVIFSGQVEVFPILGDSNTAEEKMVRGKRFTCEEDKIIEDAVWKYIVEHHLGDEGLSMVLNCKKYPDIRDCWKEIGSAIPYRPYRSTYYRAQVLFRRSENQKWTQEECERILEYHEKHGSAWKPLADELGKHQKHVSNAWQRRKLRNMNKGRWSQEEYQKLFDLVNADLQSKVSKVKSSMYGMLRDNIGWRVISDELATRNKTSCCQKWYNQLTSPMVRGGVWADSDDYRMLDALYRLDATCMEDVDWDNLVDGRAGDVCRKRWNQMVVHIGHHRHESFVERVEVLVQRYCPCILEAREAWDSKPRVP